MQTRDIKPWLVSLTLAVMVHASVLLYWDGSIQPGISSDINEPQTIHLSFSKVVVDVPVPEKKLSKPVHQKKVTLKKTETKKLETKKADIPRSEVVRVNKPETQLSETAKNESREKVSERESQLVSPQQARPAPDRQVQQAYLLRLVRHIEKFKFYPGAARRRGVEGFVSIRFIISQQGEVMSLELSSPQRILKQAAEEAIHSAEPLPLPDEAGLVNQQIQFKMHYALR